MDKIITDPVTGRRLGRLWENSSEIIAYDPFNRIVGKYNKITKKTFDGKGNFYANGDLTESLLRR